MNMSKKQKRIFCILFPIIITAITCLPSLDNELTTWDDDKYVTDNQLIRNLSFTGLKGIFSTYVWGNYHPLTVLSYAIEYNLFGLSPFIYHLDNLLLHLFNTFLIFYFFYLLGGKQKLFIPFFITLLFGIHPMHMESVVWVSGRKDLLYTIFYLSSCISYLYYHESNKNKFQVIVVVFFILSALSKGMAITLPVSLLLIDYYKTGKISLRNITDKAYLFIFSIIFGIVALDAQASGDALKLAGTLNLFERITIASYGIITYFGKLFIPIELANLYPYPARINNTLPLVFYYYFLASSGLVGLLLWLFRKSRKLMFGLFFFFVQILLVIQIVPVGEAILAERYTYLSYPGLFLIIAIAIEELWNHKLLRSNVLLQVMVPLIIFTWLSYLMITSWNRTNAWENNIALYTDLINKKGELPVAFNNRGNANREKGNYQQAIADLRKAIEIDPTYSRAYHNLGYTYSVLNRPEIALQNYNKAIELSPGTSISYLARGLLFYKNGNQDRAIQDITKAIQLSNDMYLAYYYRGMAYAEKQLYQEAIKDFTKTIEYNHLYTKAYHNRATVLTNIKQYAYALGDINIAVQQQPTNPELYETMGYILIQKKDYPVALVSLGLGISIDPEYAGLYFQRGNANNYMGKYNLAIEDYSRAYQLDPQNHLAVANRGIIMFKKKYYPEALEDLLEAINLQPDYADGYYNLSRVYFTMGDNSNALAYAQKALSLGYPIDEQYIKQIKAQTGAN